MEQNENKIKPMSIKDRIKLFQPKKNDSEKKISMKKK